MLCNLVNPHWVLQIIPIVSKMTTALLIVDMQNAFESMIDEALPNILKLASYFQDHDLPIILTQHGHSKEELTGPPFKSQLVRKWTPGGSIAMGSTSWKLLPEIEALRKKDAGIPVVAKNTYDAFINTNLEALLKERNVERVVISGVMTDCCCDTTGRSAFNRGWETLMVKDGVGSASREQHERSLKAWAFGYGDVITTKEVMKRLEKLN